MKNKIAFSIGVLALTILFSMQTNAVIIEGVFTGNVVYANDCLDDTASPVANCTPLWNDNPGGTVATGSFWYDTELAPLDDSPAESMGHYFTYSNTWLHAFLNIGGKTFDISDSAIPSAEAPGDVETMLLIDDFETASNGMEKQAILMTDKTTSIKENGDYVSQYLNISLETWEQRILNGVSLIQENAWIDNGNLLQGGGSFGFKSLSDQQLQVASAYISYTDFSMKIKNSVSIPEPSSLPLLCLAMLALIIKRKWKNQII